MWLRLTQKSLNISQLFNMDHVQIINVYNGVTTIYYMDNSEIEVEESIDEIEIMLSGEGTKVRRADSGERSWIGNSLKDRNEY